jgi:hypothetical protein
VDTYIEDRDANHVSTLLKIPFMPYRPRIEYEDEEEL